MTILLIEDEPAVRRMLNLLLKKGGFEVLQATSGEEACEMYRANPEIRLVISNASLPGMDGPATIARLRQINPQLRFCFVTGEVTREVLECGAARIFQKPFSPHEFMNTVRELVVEAAE
jgi:DNA-binding response OmpR family regulator